MIAEPSWPVWTLAVLGKSVEISGFIRHQQCQLAIGMTRADANPDLKVPNGF